MRRLNPLVGIALLLLVALAVGFSLGLVNEIFFPRFRDTFAHALLTGAITGAVCAPVLIWLLRRGGS